MERGVDAALLIQAALRPLTSNPRQKGHLCMHNSKVHKEGDPVTSSLSSAFYISGSRGQALFIIFSDSENALTWGVSWLSYLQLLALPLINPLEPGRNGLPKWSFTSLELVGA